MTEKNPALFIAGGGGHASADFRRLLAAIFNDAGGIFLATDLAATEKSGGANMSVDIATGRAAILGTEGTYQGTYFVENQGVTNVTVNTADSTDPRIDVIAARVQDAAYSGAANAWDLHYIVGTAAPSPSAPAVDSNSLKLCEIAVAAGATSIVNANITDFRSQALAASIDNNKLAATGLDISKFTVGTSSRPTSGNAGTATKLATGRTISLTGDVTGTSGSFDGSGNASIAATVAAVPSKATEQVVTFVKSGDLVTGTGTFRFYAQYALTLVEMEISVATAPTGAAILVDLNKNGTTVFSTQSNRPTVAISGFVGTTTTFNTTTLADGDYLTVDIDQIGSTVAGADLIVAIRYNRTA